MNASRFFVALGIIICLVLSGVIALVPPDTTQAQPADGPWPMFGQNSQRTGRSPYSGPKVPKLKWSFTTGGPVSSSPAIGADGTIYVGSEDYNLYAINPDGTQRWSLFTGGVIRSSPAIGADGTIYVGSEDRNLYAINPDGTKRWSLLTGAGVYSSPAIGPDGTIYVGSMDGNLYAIDPDGSQKWSSPTGGPVSSSPAIGADGIIYVGSNDNELWAINPDGIWIWTMVTGDWVMSSPAIGADGTIYVGSRDGNLYAVKKWTFTTGGPVSSSPAIGADGTIYVGCTDRNLYAINPDGSQKWYFPTGARVDSSPAIGADGTIYVGSWDAKLYAINPEHGSPKWSFTTGDLVFSSPAIGADGTIYVGSDDGNLYAITEEFDLTISSSAGGSVTDPGEGTSTYDRGTVVDLVAEAEEGYRFVDWTGDLATIDDVEDANTTITMNGDYSITANFEEEPPEEEPSGAGCFIATAAYGTPMAEEIEILRELRDEYLLANPVGQALVDLYYRVSPRVAELLNEHPGLKPTVRAGLLPAVGIASVTVSTTAADKITILGLLVLTSLAIAVRATRRRARSREYP
jgi:outer membrane protein assembly factor BamB